MSQVIAQRQVWMVDLPRTVGHEAAGRRPAIVVQTDAMNRSRWQTVLVVPTTNFSRSGMPGAVVLASGQADLPERSVAMCLWTAAVDRTHFVKPLGTLSRARFREIITALADVLAERD